MGDAIHIGIIRRSTSTGQLLGAFGSKGTGPGQLRDMNDTAVDPHGEVYVGDSRNDRIQTFPAVR